MAETRPDPVVDRVAQLAREQREPRAAAILAGIVTAVALFLWMRGAAPMVAPPAMASEPRAFASPSSTTGQMVWVHVAGAVKKPGLYQLPAGARVDDALAIAGGALGRADLDALNLAAPVIDGSQVLVASAESRPSGVTAATATSSAPGLVNLNVADQAALETLPGVGPVTATAIVTFRTEIGSFTALEQLLDVDGIGPATLESLRPYVTI